MYYPSDIKKTLTEEDKYELEKAKRTLKKFKKIEAQTPMFCTKVGKMTVCAKSEERLKEIVEQLKNK